MKMIVGLGNIGPRFYHTRHNIGFMVIDLFAEKHNIKIEKLKDNALIGEGYVENEKVILVKPTTFMNLSGKAVKALVNYLKLTINDILVIQDDLDLNLGRIKLKSKGSSGGHNGINSIINNLDSQNFKRIKIGIGRPLNKKSIVEWVLGRFTKNEMKQISFSESKVIEAIEYWIKSDNFDKTMSIFNKKSDNS